MARKIRPCQNCEFEKPIPWYEYGHMIRCPNCGVAGPTCKTARDAADAWNEENTHET